MATSLHDRDGFSAFVATLAGTGTVAQWGSLVGKVGGKVFCLLGDETGEVVFKVSEIAFAGLVEIEGIGQAAYFAKGQWVRVLPGALEPDLLAGYLRQSHGIVAARLTKKLRAELGL